MFININMASTSGNQFGRFIASVRFDCLFIAVAQHTEKIYNPHLLRINKMEPAFGAHGATPGQARPGTDVFLFTRDESVTGQVYCTLV